MRKAFFLLALLSLLFISSASKVWQTSLDSPASAGLVQLGNQVLAVSEGGYAYLLNPVSGAVTKKVDIGGTLLQPVVSGNDAFIASSDGKLARLKPDGTLAWLLEFETRGLNISPVYGIDANGDWIYLTSPGMVYKIRNSGLEVVPIYNSTAATLTPPKAGPGYVLFGEGKQFTRISPEGAKMWSTAIGGNFWTSRPMAGDSFVYVGALDGKLHSFFLNGGAERYSVETANWVMGTPTLRDGFVFFGSNDGKVYSVDEQSGRVRWAADLGRAVQSQPEPGFMGGRSVMFAGCNDNSIYAIESNDGTVVWKGSSAGWVEKPLYFQDRVVFGSRDGVVYAYSTERACSITQPGEGGVVGLKEVVVRGSAVSQAGGMRVYVRANEGQWEEANLTEANWMFYIDPAKSFNMGLNTISCKVADPAGEESGTFTSVTVSRDPAAGEAEFVTAAVPKSPVVGKPFTVYVNDGDDGSPVDRFTLTVRDKDTMGYNGNITVTINEPGTYELGVTKIGYRHVHIKVDVVPEGPPIWMIAIGGIVLLAVLLFLATKLFGRK